MNPSLPTMVGAYLDGIATIKSAVVGMFPEHLTARPIDDRWSTMEVVCHLADFEPILATRMKRIIAEERPLMFASPPESFNAALHPHDRVLEEELAVIEATRKHMARILKKLPSEALKRQGVHNERGLVTLENMLASAINHIPHHVEFIQEKRKALGLPT